MVAHDLRPTSIVEDIGFRAYSQQLNPDYKVPAASTVATYLKALYLDLKPSIVALLKNQDVALTTDLWSSIAREGYITITCHLISPSWEMKSLVIATRALPDQHTGINIRKHLMDISSEFEITKITGVTSDNASNMVVAMESGDLGLHTRCFSHTLQLTVNENPHHCQGCSCREAACGPF